VVNDCRTIQDAREGLEERRSTDQGEPIYVPRGGYSNLPIHLTTAHKHRSAIPSLTFAFYPSRRAGSRNKKHVYRNKDMETGMWSLRGAVILAFAGPVLAAPTNSVGMPSTLECVRTSHGSCGEDNVCITGLMSDGFMITFDFRGQRFHSTWGRGRITQSWDLPDGSHAVLVSAPPASSEIIFSADYRTASQRNGSSFTGYTCNSRRSRGH
jgi:hypothetical protein